MQWFIYYQLLKRHEEKMAKAEEKRKLQALSEEVNEELEGVKCPISSPSVPTANSTSVVKDQVANSKSDEEEEVDCKEGDEQANAQALAVSRHEGKRCPLQ